MPAIFFNGQLTDADAKLFPIDSPGVKFGEGIFETMLVKNDRIFLEELHWKRLITGFEKMALSAPPDFSINSWRKTVLSLSAINNHPIAKVRTTFLRNEKGETDCIIQTSTHSIKKGLDAKGLHCGLYQGARKTTDSFSNLKHNNFLTYRMGKIAATQSGWDEAIILNQYGRVCEASNYNIFIFKDGEILTPPLSEGCVAGTLRKFLSRNFSIKEQAITVKDLMDADEIMLTNSVQLLRWVERLEGKTFENQNILNLFEELKLRINWLFLE